MALTINTNIMSLNAQRNLSTSQTKLSSAIERLSSGKPHQQREGRRRRPRHFDPLHHADQRPRTGDPAERQRRYLAVADDRVGPRRSHEQPAAHPRAGRPVDQRLELGQRPRRARRRSPAAPGGSHPHRHADQLQRHEGPRRFGEARSASRSVPTSVKSSPSASNQGMKANQVGQLAAGVRLAGVRRPPDRLGRPSPSDRPGPGYVRLLGHPRQLHRQRHRGQPDHEPDERRAVSPPKSTRSWAPAPRPRLRSTPRRAAASSSPARPRATPRRLRSLPAPMRRSSAPPPRLLASASATRPRSRSPPATCRSPCRSVTTPRSTSPAPTTRRRTWPTRSTPSRVRASAPMSVPMAR